MNRFFNLDNPFFRFMERIADFVIVNFLTVLCSLPILTIGAATAACHTVMQNMLMDNEQPVLRSFFRALIGNFKQATILWLITFFSLVFLTGDYLLIYVYSAGKSALVLYCLLGVVSVMILGTIAFSFALIVRYENSLKNHLKNAMVLAIAHLPRTIIMLVVYAIPVLFAIVNLRIFLNTLSVWVTFGISLIVFVETFLVRPVFQKLEPTPVNSEDTVF